VNRTQASRLHLSRKRSQEPFVVSRNANRTQASRLHLSRKRSQEPFAMSRNEGVPPAPIATPIARTVCGKRLIVNREKFSPPAYLCVPVQPQPVHQERFQGVSRMIKNLPVAIAIFFLVSFLACGGHPRSDLSSSPAATPERMGIQTNVAPPR
jgi:hypothetical protein